MIEAAWLAELEARRTKEARALKPGGLLCAYGYTAGVHAIATVMRELGVSGSEVFRLQGPLDLRGLWAIVDLDRDDLKYPAFVPKTSYALSEVETAMAPDVLDAMRAKDVLLEALKAYTGTANKVPDSLTPRRFIKVMSMMHPMATATLCPWRVSNDDARFATAEEMDTATVST